MAPIRLLAHPVYVCTSQDYGGRGPHKTTTCGIQTATHYPPVSISLSHPDEKHRPRQLSRVRDHLLHVHMGGEEGDHTLCCPIFIGPYWGVLFQSKNCWEVPRFVRRRGSLSTSTLTSQSLRKWPLSRTTSPPSTGSDPSRLKPPNHLRPASSPLLFSQTSGNGGLKDI